MAAVVIMSGLPAKKAEAAGSVTINDTNFPDPVFQKAIKEKIDTDRNGVLSENEIENALELDVNGLKIYNLKGIEKLIFLEWLDFSNTEVETVDLSYNTNLLTVYCYHNQLTALDVSKLTKLEVLDCSENQLISLNVSRNTALLDLECYDNSLAILNVAANTNLIFLDCSYNNIISLDVTRNTKLEYLNFTECKVGTIKVGNCTKLEGLYACNAGLTSLNVSANTELKDLNCSINDISSLDLSANKKLTELDISSTKISSLSLKNNTLLERLYCLDTAMTTLDMSPCSKLEILECEYNNLTSLKLTYHPKLCYLIAFDNSLSSINISGCKILKQIYKQGGSDGHYVIEDTGEIEVDSTVNLITTSAPAVKTQPSDSKVSLGGTVKFTVSASGSSLKYQWYYRNSSTGAWEVSGASGNKTNTLTFTAKEAYSGRQYRCKVSNVYGSVYSSAATLTVVPKITTQPTNAKVSIGKTAKFTTAAEGTSLSYQWYYRTSSTDSWHKSSASGSTTATCSFTAKEAYSGRQYRCKVTGKYGSIYTKTVTLTVVPKITAQPKNVTVTEGKTAKFSVAAEGTDLTYQWYYRKSSTGDWYSSTSASGKSATYSCTGKASYNGRQYRCKVTSKYGSVYTNIVTLTVK